MNDAPKLDRAPYRFLETHFGNGHVSAALRKDNHGLWIEAEASSDPDARLAGGLRVKDFLTALTSCGIPYRLSIKDGTDSGVETLAIEAASFKSNLLAMYAECPTQRDTRPIDHFAGLSFDPARGAYLRPRTTPDAPPPTAGEGPIDLAQARERLRAKKEKEAKERKNR